MAIGYLHNNEPVDVSKVKQFSRDVAWNVTSLVVAGACGIVFNYLIGLVYDDAALGAFNQVFAGYIVASQEAALGVHHSVLQRVATADDPGERAAATSAGLLIALVIGVAVAIGFWASGPLVARLLGSDDVGLGMAWAAPALACFALDKVALGALNGLGRMRTYAVLFGGRFVLMLVGFAGCVAVDAPPSSLPVILTVAEAVTLAASLVAIRDLLRWPDELGRRVRDHLGFGVRGVGSGVLVELNTRVDVLVLGYFTSDAVVGVFSFAAILAEGLFQVLIVLRNQYAPIATRLVASGERGELEALIRRGRARTYLAAIPLGAAAVGGYWLAGAVLPAPIVAESWPYFAILIAGMVAVAGYVPFTTLLLLARQPGAYTLLVLGVVAVNAAGNVGLVAAIGPYGAPLGTGLAYLALAGGFVLTSRRLLGLRI
jgi:O-antigen/teichoic acid export membrane protein